MRSASGFILLILLSFTAYLAFAEDPKSGDQNGPVGAPVGKTNQPAKEGDGKLTPEEAIERLTINVSALARDGKLEPFVGQEDKIFRIGTILNKSKMKSVILIGEGGTGKTELAKNTAFFLKDKTVRLLSLNTLYEGTKYRGDIEERIKPVIQYLISHPDDVVIIDEAADFGGEANAKFRDALLPHLADGTVTALLITTSDEFHQKLANDKPLVSRCEIETLDLPTEDLMLDIALANVPRMEEKHGMHYSTKAIKRAVKQVLRFFPSSSPNRVLINLLDRAGSHEKMVRELGSPEKMVLEGQLKRTQNLVQRLRDDLKKNHRDSELIALVREAVEKEGVIQKKLDETNSKDTVAKLQAELTQLKEQADAHFRKGEFTAQSEILYGNIPEIEKKVEALSREPIQHSGDLSEAHIDEMVAIVAKRPLDVVRGGIMKRLQKAEAEANRKVLFQKRAVTTVFEKLRVAASNVDSPEPNFILFDGANGVGKTRLVSIISELVNGEPPVIIEGNQYQNGGSAWRLFGPDPGIVDSQAGGELEPVRRNGEVIVMIDEGNLAHPDFWEAMMRIAEGKAKDSRGRPIDARRTTFIVNANFTQDYSIYKRAFREGLADDALPPQKLREWVELKYGISLSRTAGLKQDELDKMVINHCMSRKGIAPGMRDRFTGMTLFDTFDVKKTVEVVRLELAEQRLHLYGEGILFEWGETVAEAIAKSGYDVEFNVRPIHKARRDSVSVLLSQIAEDFKRGDTVRVDFVPTADGKGGKLVPSINGVSMLAQAKDIEFKTSQDIVAHATALIENAAQSREAHSAQAAGELGSDDVRGEIQGDNRGDSLIKRARTMFRGR